MDEFTSAEKALVAVHHVVQAIGHDDLHRLTPCPDFDVAGTRRPSHRYNLGPRCGRRYTNRGAKQRFHRPMHPASHTTDLGWMAAPRIGLRRCVQRADAVLAPCARHSVSRTRSPRLGFRRSATPSPPRIGRPRRLRPRAGAADPDCKKSRHGRIRSTRAGARRRAPTRPARRIHRPRPTADKGEGRLPRRIASGCVGPPAGTLAGVGRPEVAAVGALQVDQRALIAQ